MKFARERVALVAIVVSSIFAIVGPTQRAHAAISSFDIVGPAGSVEFGGTVKVLPNGNFVVVDSSFNGSAGAVYLYDGRSNSLISALTGGSANDRVGSGGVTIVGVSNFVVVSAAWGAGAGAVTWVDGTSGLDGTVSAQNSLVGGQAGDSVGSLGITVLQNGNFVVDSPSWANGTATNAGAVTWGSGANGVSGVINAESSLVGTHVGDFVGQGRIVRLTNGNYVVSSGNWQNNNVPNAGAVTWGSGSSGVAGDVTSVNSLVGSTANDSVGQNAPTFAVTALANGNYVVTSNSWDNVAASAPAAGAATLCNGATGTAGVITPSNSLVGTKPGDQVGVFGTVALTNGNYVVESNAWANTALKPQAGAATWGNGVTGITGPVTTLNSLVGTSANDFVGTTVALKNGNYVVLASGWDDLFHGVVDAGAVTWGSGNSGVTGGMNSGTSLVGPTMGDRVGERVYPLPNGNYVVTSTQWHNGAMAGAGAATWRDGSAPNPATVGVANSLVGVQAQDSVGSGQVAVLVNGNYVVTSPKWANLGAAQAGAATWGSAAAGVHGAVGADNSLVGSTGQDQVGLFAAALPNGDYVIESPNWNNTGVAMAGASTWGNGATGAHGVVSAANSLVGTTAGDQIGAGVSPAPNGNYLVTSPSWNDNGALAKSGAVTWVSGSVGATGPVTTANSLVGSHANDQVGASLSTLDGGVGFGVLSQSWQNGQLPTAGAFTFVPLGGPTSGELSSENSVFGGAAGAGTKLFFSSTRTSNGSIVVSRPGENIVTLMLAPEIARPDFVSLPPARLADTRPGFATVDGVGAGGGALGTSTTLQLPVVGRGGVAADAVAVALNVTAVDGVADGFITVFPCGSPQPLASNLNFTVGSITPNAVFAKVGAGGTVCIFASQQTQLVVDVDGYFPTTTSYQSLNPERVLETRPGLTTIDGLDQGAGPNAAGTVESLPIVGRAGVPADATSVMLNVTVTEPVGPGFATVFPCGSPRPTASNLNFIAGATVANLVVSKLGASGKVCIFTSQATQLVIDVNGYVPASTAYLALNPARLLETRAGLTTIDDQFNGIGMRPAASVTALQITGRGGVRAGATTVMLNVTVTEPEVAGFITVYPCGISPPLASNLNYVAGATVANAVLVKVGAAGTVCLFTSQATQLITDVAGYIQN